MFKGAQTCMERLLSPVEFVLFCKGLQQTAGQSSEYTKYICICHEFETFKTLLLEGLP